jgi:hypothetical protein
VPSLRHGVACARQVEVHPVRTDPVRFGDDEPQAELAVGPGPAERTVQLRADRPWTNVQPGIALRRDDG